MEALKESQFISRYNRIMFITFSVVIGLLTVLTVIQIKSEIESFEHQQVDLFREESKALDELLARITAHLELLRTKAETYFLDTGSVAGSSLFQALAEKDDTLYSLDTIPSPYSERNLGNLTGQGNPADFSRSLRAEVEMALSLNSLFQATKENIPNSAWIYYTSKNNFINIYPWVSSDTFQFSQELYTHEFYRWGLPSENPDRKEFWTPVYIDEYGKGAMVTAAEPVYRQDEFIGTVAIDITLDKLTDYLHEFKKTGGMLMIVNERNQLITHSNVMLAKNDSEIYELADGLPESLRSRADSLFENQPMRLARYRASWLISYLYIWSKPENAENWRLIFITEGRQSIFVQIASSVGVQLCILLAALGVMLFSAKRITSQEFIRPAENLVRHIVKESANEPSPLPDVPVQWIPWFREISRIFEENRNLIEEIIVTTAAKERIESELNVAREIQMGTLPTDFTFEPEHKELDIYAYILPAREVGGDLYDFFFVDEEHLCFTLGDVAGKGVPAALFMVITKELISNNVLLGNLSPADVMTWINKMLYRGNPSSMFVTLIIGILNVKTGMVRYANGGHVPPIFVGCKDDPCYKKELSGPVVGALPGVNYKDISVTLQPGEAFFLCTDGVTEAMNEEEELFGDKRLLEDFTGMKDSSSKEAVEGVLREVGNHVGNAPQSDDIAMMMIRWNPDRQSEET